MNVIHFPNKTFSLEKNTFNSAEDFFAVEYPQSSLIYLETLSGTPLSDCGQAPATDNSRGCRTTIASQI